MKISSKFLRLIFPLVVFVSFVSIPPVSANSVPNSFSEYENSNLQYLRLIDDAKIFNQDMEEIGNGHKNAVLPVKQVREGLYEIVADFLVNGVHDEMFLFEPPSYKAIREDIPDSSDECKNMELIKEPLTFDEGVWLRSVLDGEVTTVSFNTSITFSSYYQAKDGIIIKWEEQFYYVESLKSGKVSSEIAQTNLDTSVGNREGKIQAPTIISTKDNASGKATEGDSITDEALKTQPENPSIFKATDKYFKVTLEIVPVYDNSGGSLRVVGYLTKDQVYPRVSDYGDWHQIKFGDKYGYVWEAATTQASGSDIRNENKGQNSISQIFRGVEDLAVYDNTSGALVPFGRINKGEKYPVLGIMGEWIRVDFSGRIGYVYAPSAALEFAVGDKYFKVMLETVPVYDNSGGTFRTVGYLTKGQVYPRERDYGDWHQIKFGGKYGYVWEAATTPASGSDIRNENHGQQNISRAFQAIEDLAVYDNTSGALVPFGKINKGEKYLTLGTMGEWIQIDFSGRIGYVYGPATAMEFSSDDKYFKVIEETVAVYDNSGGSLKAAGYLTKGQIYPRVSDYGDWHQIKFGDKYGYVWEAATTPTTGSSIRNENMGEKNTGRSFKATENLMVYDNTSGVLVPFGRINDGETYPLIGIMGDWLRIDFSGRIGYVYAPAVTLEFSQSDKYFKVIEEAATVYGNNGGVLAPVGHLVFGQVYPRVNEDGEWHKIRFGSIYGYVSKGATEVVVNPNIPSENRTSKTKGNIIFKAFENLEVFDSISDTTKSFGTIYKGQLYPALAEYNSDWLQVDFSGRIGYVKKQSLEFAYYPPLYGKTIVIDPGHGGKDTGALGNGIIEKNLNLNVALALKRKLESEGVNVILTRETDVYVDLYDRPRISEKVNADIFVSIHTNSAGASTANGTETYYSENLYNGESNPYSSESKLLAKYIQDSLCKETSTNNRGIGDAGFVVIRQNTVPSVLVELAFLSNESDANKMKVSGYADRAAQGILIGILKYFQ